MFDFAKVIEAVGGAFNSLFDYFKVSKEKQSETQLVKDKKRLKKATNIAECIFRITDKYKLNFSPKDYKDYEKLRKKFDNKD